MRLRLAQLVHGLGLLVEAHDLYTEVAKARKKTLGASHKDTLTARLFVAMVWADKGQDLTAREIYQEVVEGYRAALGANHADTLAASVNLAVLLKDAGLRRAETLEAQHERDKEIQEAKSLFERVIRGYNSTVGPRDARSLRAKWNYANLLHSTKNHDKACSLLEDIVKHRELMSGEKHTDTLAAKVQLAAVHQDAGNEDKMRGLLRQVAMHSTADHPWHEHVQESMSSADQMAPTA